MTSDDVFWLRVQRRAAIYEPDMARALLRAFELLRQQLSTVEVEQMVANGDVDAVITRVLSDPQFEKAVTAFRQQTLKVADRGVAYFARDIPAAFSAGQALIGFNILSPTVVNAIRALDSKVMQTLKDDTRETVRAFIENGLRDGVNPRTVGRQLRTVVGLAPNQLEAIQNFERMLKAGDREALTRALRDKRFDGTLKRALGANGQGLTDEQIAKMVEAYRKRMVAFNSETLARTATLDSFKLGQQLAYQDAIDKGLIPPDRLTKTWRGVLDNRERPEHVAMEGETVPFRDLYSNGEMIPGDSTYNCRCLSRFHIAPA